MNSRQRHSILFFALFALVFALFGRVSKAWAAPQSPQDRTYTKAELQALSELGDANAQFLLAHFVLRHKPSTEEAENAMKWLRASAAQNKPEAEFFLGYLYEHGQFVPRNYVLAKENYEAAAEQHYALAENNLASLYQHGQGVKKNLRKAFEWYLAAAQEGDRVAQINLANMYYGGDGVARDYQQTIYWLRKSAESGFPDAQNNLAYFYFHGIGVQQDYNETARLIRLAADQNLAAAETSLGYLYETGKGVPVDYVAAYSWYSRAAAGGDRFGEQHRKQLARIMTQKQLDDANAQTTAATTPSHTTAASMDNASFSLVNH